MNPLPSVSVTPSQPTPPPSRWVRWLLPSTTEVCFITLIFIMLFGRPNQYFILDGDIGWHIRAGQYMLETHSIPHYDIFSFSMPRAWWVTWEWGTEVIYAALHQHFGLNGVVFFSILLLAGSYTLLYWCLRRDGFSFLLSLLLLLFIILGSSFHWAARPHAVSYIFVVVFFHVLDRAQREELPGRWLWVLPPLMVLWVNLHAGFIAGEILLFTAGAGAAGRFLTADAAERPRMRGPLRHLSRIALACTVATLFNPNGYGLYVYILEYFRTIHQLNPINELSSPSFQMEIFQPFLVAVIALIFLLRYSRYRMRFQELLHVAVWMALALISLRNIPVMLLICAPILARLIAGLQEPFVQQMARAPRLCTVGGKLLERIQQAVSLERHFRSHLLLTTALVVLLWIVGHQGFWGSRRLMNFRFLERDFPVGAIPYLQKNRPPGPVFNECVMGGFLIYHFYPNIKVFFDGRMDMYGEAFCRQYSSAINTPEGGQGMAGWQEVFGRYRIQWAMLRPEFPLRYALGADPGWMLSYQDGQCVIFVRRGNPPGR